MRISNNRLIVPGLLIAVAVIASCTPVPGTYRYVGGVVPTVPPAAEAAAPIERDGDFPILSAEEQELVALELARQRLLSGSLAAQQQARRVARVDGLRGQERLFLRQRQAALAAERAAQRQVDAERRRRIGPSPDPLERQRRRAALRAADLDVDRAEREARQAAQRLDRAARRRALLEAQDRRF